MNPLFFRHVLIGPKLVAKEVSDGEKETLGGEKIELKKKGDEFEIEFGEKNPIKVVNVDFNASNGVIHEIDTVIGF